MIAKAKKSEPVVLDNIGPIEHLELDAKPGTITVLRGLNGRGKTTALEAIDALTRGNGKLESRDGTVGGTAVGFGVQIKVGRGGANRRTGDLVVTAVEDKLSIADFVEPNLKDPVAADGRRLKALVALAGLTADPTMFESLCETPEEFRSVVKPESLEATDPVDMASRVKRDFEAASRLQTTKAERLFGEIKAKLAAIEGLNLVAEHDREVLQRRLEMAIAAQSALNERLQLAGRAALQRQQAESSLKNLVDGYTGPSLEDAAKAEQEALDERDCQQRLVEKAEDDLREFKADLQDANSRLSLAIAAKKAAAERESSIEKIKTILEVATANEPPSDAVLLDADHAVQAAQRQSEDGVLIRAAIARKNEAEALEASRVSAVKAAQSLRDAAVSTLDVLAAGVKSLVPGLKLDGQLRIVVPHHKRGECFYSDLSHGERWRLALDLAVSAFERKGQRGVLAIPQEAWEGLDAVNRKIIADHVATTDLIVFTAESNKELDDEGDLSVAVIKGKQNVEVLS